MDLTRISEMVAALCASRTVTELTVREGATRLTVRRAPAPAPAPAGAVAAPEPEATPEAPLHTVRSPLVGIFHRRAAESQAPVMAGQTVRAGQVVGAIESMRMLYEVMADVAGTVLDVLVEEGQPVEYGQELLRIRGPGDGEGGHDVSSVAR